MIAARGFDGLGALFIPRATLPWLCYCPCPLPLSFPLPPASAIGPARASVPTRTPASVLAPGTALASETAWRRARASEGSVGKRAGEAAGGAGVQVACERGGGIGGERWLAEFMVFGQRVGVGGVGRGVQVTLLTGPSRYSGRQRRRCGFRPDLVILVPVFYLSSCVIRVLSSSSLAPHFVKTCLCPPSVFSLIHYFFLLHFSGFVLSIFL